MKLRNYQMCLSAGAGSRPEFARRFRAVRVLGLCLAGLRASTAAFGQCGSTARILGEIADQSGGVIHGATVSVIGTQRGTTRTLTTDDAGAYNAPEHRSS